MLIHYLLLNTGHIVYKQWDSNKDTHNQEKHGDSFALAQLAFLDHNRVILEDLEHRDDEKRFYCLGRVSGGIMTGYAQRCANYGE